MPDSSFAVAALAVIGAIVAGASALTRPRLAFAVLFLLASFSRVTLETPLGTMRPEMPAIATVALVLLLGERFRVGRPVPKTTLAMVLAFAVYLAVLAVSSAFIAPGTTQSMRMVAWLAISMVGGVVAFVLVRARPVDAVEPLALGGAAMGATGIVVAVMFFVAGPGFTLGIQDPDSVLPRVYALGWETNLYASFLAMSAFFAVEAALGRHRTFGLVAMALVLVGFPLGITRGAYAGLLAGVLAYVGVRLAASPRPANLPRLGLVAGGMLAVGIAASNLLLPNVLERHIASGPPSPGLPASSLPADNVPTGGSGTPGASFLGSVGASGPAPAVSLAPYPDTVGFRLERVPIALEDLRESPLIGFGAESFGQRHPDRGAGTGADHIAIMAVVVPYESGLIGAAAVLIGFGLLLATLWRSAMRARDTMDQRVVGAAAAFIGSLISTLVAYQVTNALHLAINWLVIGAATALAADRSAHEQRSKRPSSGTVSDRGT